MSTQCGLTHFVFSRQDLLHFDGADDDDRMNRQYSVHWFEQKPQLIYRVLALLVRNYGRSIQVFRTRRTNIVHLNLVKQLTDVGQFPMLRELDFKYCLITDGNDQTAESDDANDLAAHETLSYLFDHMPPQLRTLKLSPFNRVQDSVFIEHWTLDRCHGIRHLDLSNFSAVNDAVVCQIVSSCPRLQRLTLKNNQRITDASIEYMCNHEHMAQLQSLNISNCCLLTDLSIHSILHSKFQSTLTVLKVNDCTQFSAAVLSMITVSHMPQLSRLECYRTLISELESF